MKYILTCFAFTFLVAVVFAQAPNILNYQGVARNALGNALPNKNISIRLSIKDISESGPTIYSETRQVATNNVGLFSLQMGSTGATNVTGSVSTINWLNGAKFLQVEIDENGGNAFVKAGVSRLASVPYAMAAAQAIPSGSAGGSLTGSYPNPTIATGAVNANMIAAGVIPTTLPPTGPASGVLSGNYPNPTIAAGAISFGMLAPGVIPTTLPPTGAASGDLSGNYPNPTVSKIAGRTVSTNTPNNNDVLSWNGTQWTPTPIPPAALTGSGTVNNLAKFTPTGTAIANSIIVDDGNTIGIGIAPSSGKKVSIASTAATENSAIYATIVAQPATSVASKAAIYGTSTTGIGVVGLSENHTGIYGWSASSFNAGTAGVNTGAGKGVWGVASGTGTAGFFEATGGAGSKALVTTGAVQLTGINEGAGKVLTSDATGNATWQTPAATTGVIFSSPWITSPYNSRDTTIDGTCVRVRHLDAPELTAAVLNGKQYTLYFKVGSIGPYQLPYISDAGGATNQINCIFNVGKIFVYRHTYNTCRFTSAIPESYPGQPVLVNLPQSLEYRYVIHD